MKSLFDADTHEEIQNRIESLTVESTPSWGKMSVAQMCTHCQKPLEVAMGSLQLGKKKLGFMKRLVFFFKCWSSTYENGLNTYRFFVFVWTNRQEMN